MKFGRDDYTERIKDTAGLIPEDEPCFLIRGTDPMAEKLIRMWAEFHASRQADQDIVDNAVAHAVYIRQWQREHPDKVHPPDMPKE